MNTGLITPEDTYVDTGYYDIYSVNQDRCARGSSVAPSRMRCVAPGRRVSTVRLTLSGACGLVRRVLYKLGEDLLVQNGGEPVFQEEVEAFGFGADTGIELPFEYDGTVPDQELNASTPNEE